MSTPISIDQVPGPRALPVIGSLGAIDAADPFESLMDLAREYGPVYRLTIPSGNRLFVSGADLMDEICDDAHYDKVVGGGLSKLRKGAAGAGLFTAETKDPLWRRAHNILLAPFSQQAMRDYMPMMLDIAGQLTDKWERLNPDDEIDVPADMTRLTLDTIALCGFGYRFNSFYRDTAHPFIAAMVRTLEESQKQTRQLRIQTRLQVQAQRQLEEDQAFMNGLVDQLIAERRAQGDAGATNDLLGQMITGIDRESGLGLTDQNIRAQCITFLIAGHETTSGLLSFAIYFLMKNPELAERARAEVDEILGATTVPSYEQVHKLTYVMQVLNETLRLWPTAPGFTRAPLEDTVLAGRYEIPKGTPLTVLSAMLHRDPSVWGPDAEAFNPDHVTPERMSQLPPNAFKPFGTGQRACIGRQFALQEAALVLGMLLQRFEFVDHRDYQLKIKTTLTVKPGDMWIQVRRRADRPIDHPLSAPASRAAAASAPAEAAVPAAERHGTPLLVMFGSNLGTAEGIAARLAQEGTARGYEVTEGPLDEHIGALPADGATIIVSASYNGQPPENAEQFVAWLRDAATAKDACGRAAYTVFGCGNTEWAATYQAVPKLLDRELEAHGARRAHARGEGDARGDFDAQYRAWHGGLWSDLADTLGLPAAAAEPAAIGPRLSITTVNRQLTNPVILSYQGMPVLVRDNRELNRSDGAPPERSTRHVEIALPEGTTYRAGDHLGVLPRNDGALIRRVMRRFTLDAGTYLTIIPNSGTHTHLPIDEPAPLLGVLGSCVELQDVATRSDIEVMARYTADPDQRAELESIAGDDPASHARYRERVFVPHRSILDLLDEFPGCKLPFEVYLDMLPPLRPRYYSISSSPLASPEVCSVTIGVLRAPARSGDGDFTGVCSNYLARTAPSQTLFAFVREPTIPFRPPADPSTPMIMVGAGTGLAPFRGFLQERAALAGQGQAVGESLLFFGCRDPQKDYLYADELRELGKLSSTRIHTVFSRTPENGRRYVQHELAARADDVWALLERGAAVFVCGNANTIAPGVRAALTEIYRDKTGASAADAQAWLDDLKANNRLLEDLWGG